MSSKSSSLVYPTTILSLAFHSLTAGCYCCCYLIPFTLVEELLDEISISLSDFILSSLSYSCFDSLDLYERRPCWGLGYIDCLMPSVSNSFTRSLSSVPHSLLLTNEVNLLHPDFYYTSCWSAAGITNDSSANSSMFSSKQTVAGLWLALSSISSY